MKELTKKILKKRKKKLLKAEVKKIAKAIKEGSSQREIVDILEQLTNDEITEKEAKALLREYTTLTEKEIKKLIGKTKKIQKNKKRPLLKDGNILTILQQLDKQRRKFYTNADFTINNSSSLNAAFLSFKKQFLFQNV